MFESCRVHHSFPSFQSKFNVSRHIQLAWLRLHCGPRCMDQSKKYPSKTGAQTSSNVDDVYPFVQWFAMTGVLQCA